MASLNSRPMTLPICASSLASPSRSRRAISEFLQRRWNGQRLERIRGAVEVQHGVEHRLREFFDEQRDAARLLEDRMHDGSRQGALTQDRAQEAGAGCGVKRFERDRPARPSTVQGGANSGRCVTSKSIGIRAIRSMNIVKKSSVAASAQCASSSRIRTGASRVIPSSHRARTSCVRRARATASSSARASALESEEIAEKARIIDAEHR